MPDGQKLTGGEKGRLLNKKEAGPGAGPARRRLRRRGRAAQTGIVLGKFFRMFVYQNDWKVFPMAALISGLLAYVIRNDFMRSMEGTIKGAFAITCVSLWNGCFNSIQVICREREIVKREHRSGLHISSYIAAHMIYQAVLCLGQTIVLLYVFQLLQIRLPAEGLITKWFRLDLGITIFLITFAADMLALLISSIVKSTTGAMTVMPFLLIFQLVFSGGFFSLPSWSKPLTQITLSNYGLVCISAQADYNSLPMASAWNTMRKMRNTPIEGTVSVGDLLNILGSDAAERSDVIREFRDMDVQRLLSGAEGADDAGSGAETAGAAADAGSTGGDAEMKIGDLIDAMAQDPALENLREKEYRGSVTLGEVIDIFGEDEVKRAVSEQSSRAGQDPNYEKTPENILGCWFTLGFWALLYALIALAALEFVDKDKR